MPDLSGSIIVLTHPRTGSSLVMQTLRLLGAEVIGDAERHDLPPTANPKGYFENRDLLWHGLHAPALAERPDLIRGRAVKLALRQLVKRRSEEEWGALAQQDVVLLLPIRAPAELLLSREVLLRRKDGPAARSRLFHSSARNYLIDVGFLADRVCSPDFTRPAPICIDYRQAMDDPAGYVDGIARVARLSPTPSQVAGAMANIDHSLYRFRLDDGNAVRQVAKGVRPLEAAYDILRSHDPCKWERLRSSLPPWIFDVGVESTT